MRSRLQCLSSPLFLRKFMPKPNKTEENRERLLKEGVELFSEHGYHGIGLKDILGAVNIPKGSFYHYFESKEDYGAKVIEYYTDATRRQLAEAFADTSLDGLSALARFFEGMIAMHRGEGYKHGCLAGNMGAEISDTSEVCRTAVARSMEVTRDAFEQVIKRGQVDGSIRADIPASSLADVLLNSFEGAVLRMKVQKSGQALEQFREIVLKVFVAAP